MDWTPKQRSAYVSKHLKGWCAEILGAAPDEITLRNGRSRHRATKSLFIIPVDRDGQSNRKISFEVKFSPHDPSPRYSTALTQDPATGQWHPVDNGDALYAPFPASPTINISRKLTAVLLVLTLLLGIPAAFKGIKLTLSAVEGLWAYTWSTVDGTLNEVGYMYSFKKQGTSGKVGEYASPYYNTHTRLRADKELGIVLLRHVRRKAELQRDPLLVYVHPLNPKRSVLAPGIPLLAGYQLLVLLAILVPATMALSVLRDILRKRPVTRNRAVLIAAAFIFYFFCIFGASCYIFVWGYLLRSMPPAWPLLLWLVISAFLFFYPSIARRLYGYKVIRRGLYLSLIFGMIPLVAIAAGLALPYVIAATVAVMVLTVLIKPFARAGNTPLFALLISLCWVPVFTAGLLAPSRALVQLLHEILPYMPYNIGITGIENPRLMAYLDVAVGLAGIVLGILATYIDSTWRARQAAQVELLPTSRARSAAIGLVELQGRARPVSPSAKAPVLQYNSRSADSTRKQPFYLEDDTGRILIDPRASRFRTRWMTSFGGRITETVLKRREQLPDLSTPHVMTLQPGDPVYVIGTAQPNPDAPADALDSERLVVRQRKMSIFTTPMWQVSQGKMRPEHGVEDIFFLTDSKEQAARKRIMKGLWQVWAWAFLWIVMSLAMFHFQLPRTQDGYALWSMQEIIKYAAPRDRLEAVLDFFERETSPSEEQDALFFQRLKGTPLLGPFIDKVNKNLQHAQLTEGVGFLWRHHFKDASLKEVQLLVKSAGSFSNRVRGWAVARLGEATAYPDLVVPVLIQALEHDAALNVREYAAASLSHFKAAAFPAIPALVKAARWPEHKLRSRAIWSLSHLQEIPDGPAHDLFMEMVEDEADWVRQAAVQGLRNMARHTRHDARVLLELTGDPDQYTRSLSIGALGLVAPGITGFPEAVVRALFDEERLVRQSAVYALGDFATVPDEAAAPLGAMIMDKSLSSRILPLLVDMAERAAPAVPYLAEALESTDGKIAYNAAFALSRIGHAAAPAVDELTTALDHKDKYVRRYSAQALGGCGSAAVNAIPALIELQKDPDPHVSGAARSAIAQIRKYQ
ncbi:hypothetical protein D1BOALGB6SA_1684 [Olavius sp. associated proteobacterium Delta 1]|nr:hypothetical protein D1BOALGB6SA_1684 [Olavius sp. associated proteobacterium Delta 1]